MSPLVAAARSGTLLLPALLAGVLVCLVPAALAGECPAGTASAAVPAEFLYSYRPFLNSPTRLAIDADDNVYIADPLNGRVVVRAPDGRVVRDLTGLGYPVSIAVDTLGTLYVGDGNDGKVSAYDAAGQVVTVFGAGNGEFQLPAYMAVNEDGGGVHVYVVDSNADVVKRYNGGSGALEVSFGGTGTAAGRFIFPAGIAVRAGEVFVVDRRNGRVQVFDTDGVHRRNIVPSPDSCGFFCGSISTGRAHDSGLWIGETGALYLAEGSKGRLLVLSGGGAGLGTVGDFGTTPGKLRVPADMVIDSCGRLFVAASANGRVDVFGLPDHVDREQFVPGRLRMDTDPVDPVADTQLVAHLELPGYRLAEVSGILANSFAAPLATAVGDADRNAVPDLTLTFGTDLLAILVGTQNPTITVAGAIAGLQFEASATVRVVVSDADADGDGVNDSGDACPATAPGAVVGADGCAVAQLCPCDGPAPGQEWNSHGAYTQCVSDAADAFLAAALITPAARGGLLAQAGSATCGRPAVSSGRGASPQTTAVAPDGGAPTPATDDANDTDQPRARVVTDITGPDMGAGRGLEVTADDGETAAGVCPGRACPVSQRCPCGGAAAGRPWPDHAAYVSCVARAAADLLAAGAIDGRVGRALSRQAEGSNCGVTSVTGETSVEQGDTVPGDGAGVAPQTQTPPRADTAPQSTSTPTQGTMTVVHAPPAGSAAAPTASEPEAEPGIQRGDADTDGDGVVDRRDACPGTFAAAAVGADGCAVNQRCACQGPVAGEPWGDHGAYVQCVAAAAARMNEANVITAPEYRALIRQASRAQCGRIGG